MVLKAQAHVVPSDSFSAGLSLGARLKCTLQDLRLFSESHICSIYIFSCYLEQFITGIPSSVAAIPLQCLHQTRPCVFCLLFACTSSSLLALWTPPDSASIPVEHPKPCGGWKGLYWVGWLGTSGHSPQDKELFVGFDHSPFSCFSTKVFQSCGIPIWHPKQRKPMERLALSWLLFAAAVDPLLPPDPPGTPEFPGCPTPGVGVPALHSPEVPHFLLFSSFFWQDSRAELRPGALEEPQHMDTCQGREAHRPHHELSGEERRGKAKGTWL